jgi:hypothetical protein
MASRLFRLVRRHTLSLHSEWSYVWALFLTGGSRARAALRVLDSTCNTRIWHHHRE